MSPAGSPQWKPQYVRGRVRRANTVMTMAFLRRHEGVPFRCTRVPLPMEIGRRLHAGTAPARIDRLCRERELTPLELAVNHFHPDRYSYRIRLEHATFPTARGPR